MKEELLKILNTKLDDINNDINSLVELNEKISNEEEKLSYMNGILDLFKENNDHNIMNFSKLSKTDFNEVLDILVGDVKDIFSSPSCNYDGLVYLIDGINNGVSLTLTDEQKNAISYLIEKMVEKKNGYENSIEVYNVLKGQYEISDVNELEVKKENYLNVLSELNSEQYVSNIYLLQEAISFSETPSDKVIEILKYLLEYNANVYKNGTDEREFTETKEPEIEVSEEELEPFGTVVDEPIETEVEENVENSDDYQEFHFNDVVKDDFTNFEPLSFDNYNDETEEVNENVDDSLDYSPAIEEYETEENSDVSNDTGLEEEQHDNYEEEITYDNDEKVSTNDLHGLLGKYDIKEENTLINELVIGDIKNYEEVLNTLDENGFVDSFKKNSRLLVETLLYSNKDAVQKVFDIIKDDLSVDKDDYIITTNIAIDTIPSIFVIQDGNYNNFIENIKIFKELDLNLINLFDFSKEVFVADHDTILNNLEIVEKYDIKITYQNAKYLLLLHDVGDRLDYFVESVYEDKHKKEVFDGIKYINEYTAKLNTVTDETIKRLRYSSENSKKLFGSKPGSLLGDITNLKVNSLDITAEYLNKFFDNEFDNLTGEETREYIKLIHNSSNVGNYDDELDKLEQFRDGLRYVIEGINISRNKVLRNYSILRSYGIDTKKALSFAVCYNLVITKEEYDKLKSVLEEIGGDR